MKKMEEKEKNKESAKSLFINWYDFQFIEIWLSKNLIVANYFHTTNKKHQRVQRQFPRRPGQWE